MKPGELLFRAVALGAGLLVLATVGGAGVSAANRGLHDRLVARAMDARPDDADLPWVLIEIDDTSVAELGRFPWSRNVFARLVDRVASSGARAIVFDVVFSEPADESGDAAFADALARAPWVGLAMVPGPNGGLARSDGALRPLPMFEAAVEHLGHIGIAPEPDGTVRAYPFALGSSSDPFPSLAWTLVEASGVPSVAVGSNLEIRVDWAAMDTLAVPRLPVAGVLTADDSTLRAHLEGRVAVVAASYTGGTDEGPTPFTARLPRVWTHLYAAETARSGLQRGEVAGWVPPLLALLLAAVLWMPAVVAHPGRLAAGTLAASGVPFLVSWAAFSLGGPWFPPFFTSIAVLLEAPTDCAHGGSTWTARPAPRRSSPASSESDSSPAATGRASSIRVVWRPRFSSGICATSPRSRTEPTTRGSSMCCAPSPVA